jgi:hypothetical protein
MVVRDRQRELQPHASNFAVVAIAAAWSPSESIRCRPSTSRPASPTPWCPDPPPIRWRHQQRSHRCPTVALILEKAVLFALLADGTLSPTDVDAERLHQLRGGLLVLRSIRASPPTASCTCSTSRSELRRTLAHSTASRFTMTGSTISPASELPPSTTWASAGNRNGGDLHIGADGDLYVWSVTV